MNPGEATEQQIHRIGNLLLLPQRLNSEATRNSFIEKKSAFRKSEGLRTVKEVIQKRDWRQFEIEDREKRILKFAKTAWADLR